ncbi:hypothetical protein [Mucilaginibacter polytrichastri]|uniref:Uncharacterized protein n=1 Tax=Mucilaginibacter polytrichastri TaxID=1302689 RepID=A0A1Q5ZS12_9SPHI|nr:hypothetical protein [Mucilaginibacter polytrichastri]OKS84555.1 hypothetical protein RG47T_5245 [Mucilaginibacter polytrichastri]SFT23946.1 hypothetical protein SAMN04487890_12159 [Mucilaginibacter polytrichastri]
MKLNSTENRYETNLLNTSNLMAAGTAQLVSIKIRPIDSLPHSDEDEFCDAYVYPDEYQNFRDFLSAERLIATGLVNQGQTVRYANVNGEDYLFVEHETGPEIIAALALITSSLTLGKSIVDLITTIIKTVSESGEKKRKGEPSGRYQAAKAITIENVRRRKPKSLRSFNYLPPEMRSSSKN